MVIRDYKYMKVYWELLPYVEYDIKALLLICYIIDVYKTLDERFIVNGEEYRRLSDSYIQERLDMSSPTIRKLLDFLEKKGLIKIHKTNMGGYKNTSARYIELMVEIESKEFNEKFNEKFDEKFNEKFDEKFNERNFQENIPTNQHTNILTDINKSEETNKSTSSSLSEKKENNTSYKGHGGDLGNSKSQTMVRSQVYGNYTGELGEIIVKWYDAVGVSRKITFNQIKDKVDQLRKDCKGDENMMVKQINYSYLNGYPIWYPPKNTTQKNVTNSVSVRPGEVDKSGYRNYI